MRDFERTGCDEADAFLASPKGQEALEFMDTFRCPDCHLMRDNPAHALGCERGRAEQPQETGR